MLFSSEQNGSMYLVWLAWLQIELLGKKTLLFSIKRNDLLYRLWLTTLQLLFWQYGK